MTVQGPKVEVMVRESGVMRYELWGGGEDEWRAKMKARKGFLIFYCALLDDGHSHIV